MDDNRAWGRMAVGGGDSLTVNVGTGTDGDALYVDTRLLGEELSQISALVSNGLSIYYNPFATGNDYLSGDTYALSGGGFLAPMLTEPVPRTRNGCSARNRLSRTYRGGSKT